MAQSQRPRSILVFSNRSTATPRNRAIQMTHDAGKREGAATTSRKLDDKHSGQHHQQQQTTRAISQMDWSVLLFTAEDLDPLYE
jgi:hypothetical protein